MTGCTSHQLCFLEPLFRLFTQGCRIAMLERIQLVISWRHNTQNDVGLTPESFKKLNEPVDRDWLPDEYCAIMLERIKEAGQDQEDIIIAIRTPTIDPVKFRPYKHRDLRALESIIFNWLDLVSSPVNPILGNHGERTSAVYGVIPIVNALFIQYNNIINTECLLGDSLAKEIGEQAKNKKTRYTEPESSRDSTRVSKDLCVEIGPLMKVLSGLETTLKGFNIIDFTQDGVHSLLKESLVAESFNKLTEPVDREWEADEYCSMLLKSIREAGQDQEDIIVAIRTPVIDPIKFHPYKHRDLRALESIVVNWLDLVSSPVNPILGNHGERTSAIYGVIPIVNALFLQYNNMVSIEWIEIEDSTTKRHKWDGLMLISSKGKMAIVIMEFAGGFARDKETKNNSDTKKLYRNALRVLNSNGPSACALQPRDFTILTTNNMIYFEVLTQVDNEVYVRKRLAFLTLPMSYPGLITSVAALPSVFSWRDAVIVYANKLPDNNKTSNAFEIVSPISSQ